MGLFIVTIFSTFSGLPRCGFFAVIPVLTSRAPGKHWLVLKILCQGWEMVQAVNWLLCKLEELSLYSQHPPRKPGSVVYTSNSIPKDAEKGRSLEFSDQLNMVFNLVKLVSFGFSEIPYLTKKQTTKQQKKIGCKCVQKRTHTHNQYL